jgi:hypothetical protein
VWVEFKRQLVRPTPLWIFTPEGDRTNLVAAMPGSTALRFYGDITRAALPIRRSVSGIGHVEPKTSLPPQLLKALRRPNRIILLQILALPFTQKETADPERILMPLPVAGLLQILVPITAPAIDIVPGALKAVGHESGVKIFEGPQPLVLLVADPTVSTAFIILRAAGSGAGGVWFPC